MATMVVALVVVLAAPVEVSGGSLVVRASCADAATAQATVNIGMVVDFGDLKPAGDSGRVQATCVGVSTGTHGVAMLQAAGHSVGMDSSGLLCAIDGLPSDWQPGTRCGERTATGYRYWAYFHGTGSSWSYSSIGPAGYRAAAGTVEGWHFVEGAGNPSDPPPGRPPTNICPSAPPPTVAPTTAPPPLPTVTPVAPVATTAPAPSSPTGGANPTAGANGAAPGATTTSPGAPSSDGALPADPSSETIGASPPGTDAEPGSAPGTTTIGADGVASDVTVLAVAASSPPPGPGSEGGAPVATVVAVVLVAALGGAAAWRLRGRSDATA